VLLKQKDWRTASQELSQFEQQRRRERLVVEQQWGAAKMVVER
jgi:hypothetical protein